MARSLNKVQLIGNLTRDPELRYTPTGTAVCSFSVATNRGWTTDSGEKKEETDFHRVVAWNKLAELCSQLLTKGRKVYVEGRLANRKYTGQDGQEKQITEIVIEDMLVLDSRRTEATEGEYTASSARSATPAPVKQQPKPETPQPEADEPLVQDVQGMSSEEIADDIPF